MAKKRVIVACIVAAVMVVSLAVGLSLYFVYRSTGPFSGFVTDESGAPLEGVCVTDGRNVVKTDAAGKFYLDGYHKSRFVTVTIPSGYNADDFYIPVEKGRKSYDFRLTATGEDYADGHSFLQISDSEIGKDGTGAWLDHVKGLVDEYDPAFLIHTGDICFADGLKQHIKDMNSANMGLPVRYVIGNHDYVEEGPYGEYLYEQLYGPVWYSFDVGNVHYVVTPFQFGDYASGYDKNDRWKWLANDLAQVSPDKKVVMFNHTTPPSDDYVISYGMKKLDLKAHNLIAWVFGHYHYNYITENGGVLDISTSRPDTGGIDSSPAASRMISVASNGEMSSRLHYYGFAAPTATPDSVWQSPQLQGNVLFCDTLVAGDTVYIATNDDGYPRNCGIYALDAVTGEEKWYFATENSIKNKLLCADGKIVAQDCDGKVYCLDAASGKLLWSRTVQLGNSLGTSTGICTDGETVFAGCAAQITALDLQNGDVRWSEARNRGENSPAEFVLAGDKLLVSSHWDTLAALDKNTGKELWHTDTKNQVVRFRSSTPAVVDEHTLLIADNDGIALIDAAKGKILSETRFDDYLFSSSAQPYIAGGVAYIATAKQGVVAFDLESKEILWNCKTGPAMIFTAPYTGLGSATVESAFLRAGDTLVFGASDGYVYTVDMSDGSVVDRVLIGAPVLGGLGLHEGKIVVADFSGRVFKLN